MDWGLEFNFRDAVSSELSPVCVWVESLIKQSDGNSILAVIFIQHIIYISFPSAAKLVTIKDPNVYRLDVIHL